MDFCFINTKTTIVYDGETFVNIISFKYNRAGDWYFDNIEFNWKQFKI